MENENLINENHYIYMNMVFNPFNKTCLLCGKPIIYNNILCCGCENEVTEDLENKYILYI